MKAFAIFMTILMLVAGIDFCEDGDIMQQEEKVELSAINSDKHVSEDICSPFCNCPNCPFSILIPYTEKPLTVSQPVRMNYPDLKSRSPIEVSLNVWQPPKLTWESNQS